MRRGPVAALALALAGGGCARLPAALAPVPAPTSSALELEAYVRGEDRPRYPFAADAGLRTADGDSLAGRAAILDYLTAPPTAPVHGFTFFTGQVVRCSRDLGFETGTYRAVETGGGRATPIGGRWFAEWRRARAGWEIAEGRMLKPGERLPPTPEWCVGTESEVRARARFTASLQGAPFGIFTARPHRGLEDLSGMPYRSTGSERPGAIVSASYRVGRWLTVGGYWGLDPLTRTTYRLDQDTIEWLRSTAWFAALTAGYEGRNVSVDAGPAWVRSSWEWTNSWNDQWSESADYSDLGAVVTARWIQPVASDLGIEAMVQRRFFKADVVPGTDPAIERSRSGFFLGLGVVLRRTR